MNIEEVIDREHKRLYDRMKTDILMIKQLAEKLNPDTPFSFDQMFRLNMTVCDWKGLYDEHGYISQIEMMANIRKKFGSGETIINEHER